MICPECGKKLTDEDAYGHDCEAGPKRLPIVKYQGELWYVDFRLKEKRNYYTALPDRFDSSGIDEEYYREKLKEGKRMVIVDLDGANPDEW